MPSGAFLLHRQVHVDSLLRSFTDKVDMGCVHDVDHDDCSAFHVQMWPLG